MGTPQRKNQLRSRIRGAIATCVLTLALSCSRDAEVGCSPTPSCSAREDRFGPRDVADGGPDPCDDEAERCEAVAIGAGALHTCAIARAGEVVCWGSDAEGQRGDGTQVEPSVDAGVLGRFSVVLEHARRLAVGRAHTCALTEDGVVWCWGRNAEGQVTGEPSESPIASPRLVTGIGAATEIDAGDAHTCAVVEDGVVCWGDARFGQSGGAVGDAPQRPGLVDGTSGAIAVAAGSRHSCAAFGSGRVACWGERLGPDGAPDARATAQWIEGLDDVTAVSAGAGHTCAIRAGGRLVCWGTNESGQLGDGTTISRATPVEVGDLDPILAVSCGGGTRDGVTVGHTCAVDSGFFVQCWGRNREGQLGIGSAQDATTRQTVRERPDRDDEELYMDDAVAIAAGAFHACA
ncbi:MAG: hypothetical protein IT379_19900, partial [Deltaproteobacteria bacterium]|nr:hypothetical protein [Deltaproteobacteria bacterium]